MAWWCLRNASDGILSGLIHANALKGALVGAIVHLILSLPWVFSIRSVEKISGNLEKQILKWNQIKLEGEIILSSIPAVLVFLFWPYEAHGRSGAYKTVMAIIEQIRVRVWNQWITRNVCLFLDLTASREIFMVERHRIAIVYPKWSCGESVGSNLKEIDSSEDSKMTPEAIECCSLAYQAFVKKVGVSYAIFEAEQYCEVECPIISDCLDVCDKTREACRADGRTCKDAYRKNCVLSCPNPEPEQ